MEALTPIILQLAGTVFLGLAGKALLLLNSYLKAKLTHQQYITLDQIASMAAWAVEQQGSGPFATKKEAATELVKANAPQFDAKTISAAIESAVANEINWSRHSGDTHPEVNP